MRVVKFFTYLLLSAWLFAFGIIPASHGIDDVVIGILCVLCIIGGAFFFWKMVQIWRQS